MAAFEAAPLSGGATRRFDVRVPGAQALAIADVAVSPSGGYAAAVSARDADGRHASFLAWLNSAGETTKIVRTTPYAAARIVFSVDGRLWAAGRAREADYSTSPVYDVVRVYGQDGIFQSSHVPSSLVPPTAGMHACSKCFFAGAAHGAVLVSETHGRAIFVDLQGRVTRQASLPASGERDFLTGIAVSYTHLTLPTN